MRFLLIGVMAAAALTRLSGQVQFAPSEVAITVDGKPFTTFHYGDEANKPFLAPLRSASGKVVTRRFPMETVAGESRDHLHHRGLWFSYDDVNGVKFWENDPSYTKGKIGKIVVTATKWKDGPKSGVLTATIEWRAPDGEVLLRENREMTFYPDPQVRVIDFHTTLTAATDVTIGDTKEGAFAIRLAENFTERKGLKMTDSEGRTGMANVWGKRASWVDYAADVDGEKLGVAILDHPSNPGAPTYWHARDYGLFALNPFGQSAFDSKAEERKTSLASGKKLEYRWRVVIHPGDAETGHVADLYRQFAGGK